jgi:hypothetical protein
LEVLVLLRGAVAGSSLLLALLLSGLAGLGLGVAPIAG